MKDTKKNDLITERTDLSRPPEVDRIVKMPNRATVMALFHLYVFPDPLYESATNIEAVRFLVSHRMIERDATRAKTKGKTAATDTHNWVLTEKGYTWMEAVMNMPLPVSTVTWTIPKDES